MPPAGRRLVVLQSFRAPRPTSNPYLTLLLRSLPAPVEPLTFSWRRALLGDYDVLHLHWPELLLRSATRRGRAARAGAVALLLLRWRLRPRSVVRTVHNPAPHEGGNRLERVLLRALEARTTLTVHLSPRTVGAVAPGVPAVVVPHGHYRDWYPAPARPAVPGRVVHAGLLRGYKNVGDLVDAFRATPGPWQLHVAGAPADPALAERLRAAARADPRIEVDLRHLDDAELVEAVARAELVALPYEARGGSGAQLLALSLDRPVLLPAGPAAAELAAEVGPGWVLTFSGPLDGEGLRAALRAVRETPRGPHPDLSRREWSDIGAAHERAYRHAVGDPTGPAPAPATTEVRR